MKLTRVSLLALVTLASSFACSAPVDAAPPESPDTLLFAAPVIGVDPDTRADASVAKYPFVLAHGFNASPTNSGGFYQVKEGLEGDGHTVYVAWVAPFATVNRRANELKAYVDQALQDQIDQGVRDPKVNIIAHSMGGLDARELISVLGYGDRIASLTTIATPHRGSEVADFALGLIPGHAEAAVNALSMAFATSFTTADLAQGSDLMAAFTALAEASADDFNRAHPDDSRVYYQSWAGVTNIAGIRNPQDESVCASGRYGLMGTHTDVVTPVLAATVPLVAHFFDLGETKPNDGMVMVESAKWGNFQGCIPADHYDELGQIKHKGSDWHSGFDHIRFYRNVAYDLAAAGF